MFAPSTAADRDDHAGRWKRSCAFSGHVHSLSIRCDDGAPRVDVRIVVAVQRARSRGHRGSVAAAAERRRRHRVDRAATPVGDTSARVEHDDSDRPGHVSADQHAVHQRRLHERRHPRQRRRSRLGRAERTGDERRRVRRGAVRHLDRRQRTGDHDSESHDSRLLLPPDHLQCRHAASARVQRAPDRRRAAVRQEQSRRRRRRRQRRCRRVLRDRVHDDRQGFVRQRRRRPHGRQLDRPRQCLPKPRRAARRSRRPGAADVESFEQHHRRAEPVHQLFARHLVRASGRRLRSLGRHHPQQHDLSRRRAAGRRRHHGRRFSEHSGSEQHRVPQRHLRDSHRVPLRRNAERRHRQQPARRRDLGARRRHGRRGWESRRGPGIDVRQRRGRRPSSRGIGHERHRSRPQLAGGHLGFRRSGPAAGQRVRHRRRRIRRDGDGVSDRRPRRRRQRRRGGVGDGQPQWISVAVDDERCDGFVRVFIARGGRHVYGDAVEKRLHVHADRRVLQRPRRKSDRQLHGRADRAGHAARRRAGDRRRGVGRSDERIRPYAQDQHVLDGRRIGTVAGVRHRRRLAGGRHGGVVDRGRRPDVAAGAADERAGRHG